MIKFFRRIRRKLIGEGNLKKYLFYAGGEILLVMIGILLALQVNSWNQNRLERIEEQNILLNLKKDFELNQSNLLPIIKRLEGNIKGVINILNYTGQKYNSAPMLDLDSLLIVATSTPRFFAQNGFLNELISSGKLNIIQNAELRNHLSSWQSSINLIADRVSVNQIENLKMSDFVSKHGNWLRADSRYTLNINLPVSGFETTNLPLLQSNEFENKLDVQIVFKDGLLQAYNSTFEICERILSKIEQELN